MGQYRNKGGLSMRALAFFRRHKGPLLSAALLLLLTALLLYAAARPDRHVIEADWDEERRTLCVQQTTLLTNRTGAALTALDFRLCGNAFAAQEGAPVSKERFSAAYPSGFSPGETRVRAAFVNGREASWEWADEARTILRLHLPFSLRPQGGVEISLAYEVQLGENRLRTGVSARQARLCNLFALLCPHDGERFRHDAYGPIGDPFVTSTADWEVTLRAPTRLVAAGPGLQSVQDGVWRFSGRNLRDFALTLSVDYCVAQGEAAGATVRSFAFTQESAERALAYACRALDIYAALFGDYPFPDFTVCAADLCAGGMEYPALALVGAELYEQAGGALEYAVAHEAAHQWWYAAVGSDQVLYPWQDEALAEYSALLYVEAAHGEAAFDALCAARLAPALEIPALQGVGVAQPLTRFASEEVYDAVVYRRGAAMLHDVRGLLGDEAFFAALRQYFAQNRFAVAPPGALLKTFGADGAARALSWLRGETP